MIVTLARKQSMNWEWINKCILSIQQNVFSHRNEKLIHATRWINLKNILLSKRSQTQKIAFIRNFKKKKNLRKQISDCLKLEVKAGSDFKQAQENFGQNFNYYKIGL